MEHTILGKIEYKVYIGVILESWKQNGNYYNGLYKGLSCICWGNTENGNYYNGSCIGVLLGFHPPIQAHAVLFSSLECIGDSG